MGEQYSDRASRYRKQQTLGEQLLNNAPTACADRQPYDKLPLPLRRLRQKQIRNVRTGDQQHQSNDTHEDQQRL